MTTETVPTYYLPLASLRALVAPPTSDVPGAGGLTPDLGVPPAPRPGIELGVLRDLYRGVWSAHVKTVVSRMPCRDAYVVASRDLAAMRQNSGRGNTRITLDGAAVMGAEHERMSAVVAVHLLHPTLDAGAVLNLAVMWLTATVLSRPDLTLEKLDAWVQRGPAREGNNPEGRLEPDAHKDAPGAVRVRTLVQSMVDAGVWPQMAVDMVSEGLRAGLIERVSPTVDADILPTADWICLGRAGLHRILEVCVCGLAPASHPREERLGTRTILAAP